MKTWEVKYRVDMSGVKRLVDFAYTWKERAELAKKKGIKIVGKISGYGALSSMITAAGAMSFNMNELIRAAAVKHEKSYYWEIAENKHFIPKETCQIPKGVFGAIVTEPFEIDLILSPNDTWCDAHCMGGEVLRFLGYPVHIVDYPYRRRPQFHENYNYTYSGNVAYTPQAFHFLLGEYKELEEVLTKLSGQKPNYKEFIKKANQVRRLVREIQDLRKNDPTPLSNAEMQLLLSGGGHFFGDLDTFLDILKELKMNVVEKISKREGFPHNPLKLAYCGARGLDVGNLDFVERLGGVFLGWQTPATFAHFEINEEGDPLEALVEDFLSYPMRSDCDLRISHLKSQIEKYEVEGVIINAVHGCQYNPVDANILKEMVEKDHGIPALVIDTGLPGEHTDQARKNIETFIEILNMSKKESGVK